MVVTDATVVASGSSGSGRQRTGWTRVSFSGPDGRMVSAIVTRSIDEGEGTKVRIRYNPHNPKEVSMDSDAVSYIFALTMLFGAGAFIYAAYVSSLHNGERHFM